MVNMSIGKLALCHFGMESFCANQDTPWLYYLQSLPILVNWVGFGEYTDFHQPLSKRHKARSFAVYL